MKAREWRIKPPHIHGTVENCIGGREIRHCDGCGASEAAIGVPDRQLPTQPCWPGFLTFVDAHQDCTGQTPRKPITEENRRRRSAGQKRRWRKRLSTEQPPTPQEGEAA